MSKAVVLLSGGLDSTVALYLTKQDPTIKDIETITFDYGQRNIAEVFAAQHVARLANVPFGPVELPRVLIGSSALLTGSGSNQPLNVFNAPQIPAYGSAEEVPTGVDPTFVPARNIVFLAVAANRAIATGADRIVIGINAGGAQSYADCRPEFVDAMKEALAQGLFGTTSRFSNTLRNWLEIATPVMCLSKEAVARATLSLPGCYGAAGFSMTSYAGEYPPVTMDRASLLRQEAFKKANIPDPLIVRAYYETKISLPDTNNYMNWMNSITACHTGPSPGPLEVYGALEKLRVLLVDYTDPTR